MPGLTRKPARMVMNPAMLIRYLVLFVVLAFACLGLVAVIRAILRGSRHERGKRD